MDLTIKGLNGVKHTVELGEDDTPAVMRRKVASAVGLPEDGFVMSFGGEAMDEGYDMTQLSAGDTIELSTEKKVEARAALHALGERDITAERLVTVEDPEVACLLLQAEVATVIPNQFLAQTSLTALDLSAVSCVTEIRDQFLYGCISLTSVDLSGMTRLTRIGSSFLDDCSSLTAVDLSPLRSVTHICTGFLQNCTSLTAVDLSPLRNVTQIGTSFLRNCTSLTAVDLSPLSNVTHIYKWFLLNCSSLTELDLSPLSRVTHFDENSAYNCTSLRSIHLGGCSSAVSSRVREGKLKKYVVDAPPTRGRDKAKATVPRCSVS